MRVHAVSPLEKRSVMLVFLMLLMSSGCESNDAGTVDLVTSSSGKPGACSNEAWSDVYSGILPRTTSVKKGSLPYLMASAEFAKQQIRTRGKEMWERCPDDRRRYDWLLVTTHLDPEWPTDLVKWAIDEKWPRDVPADIDWERHYEWSAEFEALKAEFENSSPLSKQNSRYLELGELTRAIRLAALEKRTGEKVDSSSLVTRVLSFLKAYTGKVNSLDRDPYEWSVTHIIYQLTDNADVLDISAETRKDFVEYVNRSVLERLERWSISAERLNSFSQGRPVDQLVGSDMDNAGNPWLGFPGSFYQGQPVPIVSDQPHNSVSVMVHLFKREIAYRQYREFGLRLIGTRGGDFDDVRWWFHHTNSRPPSYISEVSELLGPNGSEFGILSTLSRDGASLQSWKDKYQEIRSWIFEDSSTGDDYRLQIARRETRDLLDRNFSDQTLDREAGLGLLDSIYDLYTNAPVPRPKSALSDIRTFVSVVVREYGNVGLSRQDVWDFLGPVQDFADDKFLATVATGWRNLYSADREIAPKLKLESMDHGPIDLRDFRGKIVLLDFWSTNCSSCIAAFPRLRDLEKEYAGQGFVVVSIGFDAARKEKTVRRIKSEMDLTWPTLVADDDALRVRQSFGVFAVPDYVLLDRNGYAVADTSQIDMGRNLKTLLNEILAAEAAEMEAATVH